MKKTEMKINDRYYLDPSKTAHGKLTGWDEDGDPVFTEIIGDHPYRYNDDGTLGFADLHFYPVEI